MTATDLADVEHRVHALKRLATAFEAVVASSDPSDVMALAEAVAAWLEQRGNRNAVETFPALGQLLATVDRGVEGALA